MTSDVGTLDCGEIVLKTVFLSSSEEFVSDYKSDAMSIVPSPFTVGLSRLQTVTSLGFSDIDFKVSFDLSLLR